VNKSLNTTRKHFDEMMASKPKAELSDFDGKMGRRDKVITKLLHNYKVNKKSCLDIGPGTGRWIKFLKNHEAFLVDGADLSKVVLEKCEKLCNNIYDTDLEHEKINTEDDKYDIILCLMVLEHIKSPDNLIKEIIRVSKNGSLVIFSIPNIISFVSRLRIILGQLPLAIKQDKTHIKFYRKAELKNLFKNYNQKVSVHPTSFSINPFNTKSFRVRSNRILAALDDHILFSLKIKK